MRVLVVEDDPAFRRLLERYFGKRGTGVMAVGSISQATRVLAVDEDFDVVLTDLNLPDGRGPHVLRQWVHPTPRPSLVVMTGAGEVEQVEGVRFEVLHKPFTLPALSAVLERLPRRLA